MTAVLETVAEALETVAEVLETVAEALETVAEVLETVAEVLETVAEVLETVAEVLEATISSSVSQQAISACLSCLRCFCFQFDCFYRDFRGQRLPIDPPNQFCSLFVASFE